MLGDLRRQIRHTLVEARQCDAPTRVVQIRNDLRQHADRVDRGATEETGMQITRGAADDDLFQRKAAQHGRDHRRGAIPHARIANQGKIG